MLFYTRDDATLCPEVLELRDLLETAAGEGASTADVELRVRERFSRQRAVMILDMCGLSRITRQQGPIAVLALLHHMQRLVTQTVWAHDGRIVNTLADSICCVFADVDSAVATADELLRRVELSNLARADDQQLGLSFGIGWGELLVIGTEQVFGDEVNVAGKLGEDVAGPGEVLLSEAAYAALASQHVDAARREAGMAGVTLRHLALDLDL